MKNDRRFKFHPKCKRTSTIGLVFADDLLIFSKGDVDSMKAVKEHLQIFSKSSSLSANLDKSVLYLAGLD